MNFLFLPPKFLSNKIFQIFIGLFDHYYSFKSCSCLLGHEAFDEFKLTEKTIELTTPEFKIDNPVGHNAVKIGLLTYLNAEVFVGPQPIAEVFEDGQHFQGVQLIEVEHFVEDGQENGGVDDLRIMNNDFVEHAHDIVLLLDVLLLRDVEEVDFFQL